MISSRAKYATRAVLELALHTSQEPLGIQEIALRQNIPLKFLQQILNQLKTTGLVVSKKGPGGGYSLARKPEQVMLAEVLRAMDGPLALVSCTSKMLNEADCGCPHPDTCSLRDAFGQARSAMLGILEHTSFADLAKREKS